MRVRRLIEWGFAFLYRCEPNFTVFWDQQHQKIAGYCIYPADVQKLRRALLTPSNLVLVVKGFTKGQIPVKGKEVMILLGNKIRFLFHSCSLPCHSKARILSIAVDPQFRGQGIGKELLKHALSDLHRQKRQEVRLEVRPSNSVASGLYEQMGFRRVSEIYDGQGPWGVMVKQLEPQDGKVPPLADTPGRLLHRLPVYPGIARAEV